MTSRRRSAGSWVRRLVVLAATIAVTIPGTGGSAEASHMLRGYWQYGRFSSIDSTLFWVDTTDGSTISNWWSWRAGSGNGSRDECARSAGWLPLGWYDQWGHWDTYNGDAIKGRTWRVSDKACYNGTVRTGLFIHTEQTQSNGQNCGIESQCWEKVGDYYSLGCIKISYPNYGFPNSIGDAHARYGSPASGGTTEHGSHTMRWALYVWS